MIDVAKRTGIEANLDEVASLPLGTSEINILDYATGYTTFASGGYKKNLYFIERIEDLDGNLLYQHEEENSLVINPNYTYILNELLANTYDYNLKSYTSPTCLSIAPKLTKKYAVKSGTTDYDLWTVGYNPDIIVGVWTGYDDNRKLASNELKYSKNIWADTIEGYLREKDARWYEKPDNVVGVLTDMNTGEVATNDSKLKKILYYVKGTEPGYKNKVNKKSNKKTTTN